MTIEDLGRHLRERVELLDIFSDHEDPCTSVEEAQRRWNIIRTRELTTEQDLAEARRELKALRATKRYIADALRRRDATLRFIARAGWGDLPRKLEAKAQAYREKYLEVKRILNDLKTESGRAAFAMANDWPLPEEKIAWMKRVEELTAQISESIDTVHHTVHKDRAMLAEGIAKLAVEVGIITGDAPLTLPQVMMLLDDLANELRQHTSEQSKVLESVLMSEPLEDGQYVHLLVCNGDRRLPPGAEGCQCPVGIPARVLRLIDMARNKR